MGLKDLKPGDKAVEERGVGGPNYRIVTVHHTTATQIVTSNACRYRIDSGKMVGGTGPSWDVPKLRVEPWCFHKAREQDVHAGLEKRYPLTREGIESIRQVAQRAEDFLNADDALKAKAAP